MAFLFLEGISLSKEGLFCVGFRWNKKKSFSFLIPPESKRETLIIPPPPYYCYLSHLFENSDFAQSYPIFAGLASVFSFKVCGQFYLVTLCFCESMFMRKICNRSKGASTLSVKDSSVEFPNTILVI
jgi:hypothetical protein